MGYSFVGLYRFCKFFSKKLYSNQPLNLGGLLTHRFGNRMLIQSHGINILEKIRTDVLLLLF